LKKKAVIGSNSLLSEIKGCILEEKNPSHSNPEIQNKSNYQPKIVHFVMVDEASSIPLMPQFTQT